MITQYKPHCEYDGETRWKYIVKYDKYYEQVFFHGKSLFYNKGWIFHVIHKIERDDDQDIRHTKRSNVKHVLNYEYKI